MFDLAGLGLESEENGEPEEGGLLAGLDVGAGKRGHSRVDARGKGEQVIARELSTRVLRECQVVEAEAGDTHAAFVAALRRKFGEIRCKVEEAELAAKAAEDTLEVKVQAADARYAELERRVQALEKRAASERERCQVALLEEDRRLSAECAQVLSDVERHATMFAEANQDYKALAGLVGNLLFTDV